MNQAFWLYSPHRLPSPFSFSPLSSHYPTHLSSLISTFMSYIHIWFLEFTNERKYAMLVFLNLTYFAYYDLQLHTFSCKLYLIPLYGWIKTLSCTCITFPFSSLKGQRKKHQKTVSLDNNFTCRIWLLYLFWNFRIYWRTGQQTWANLCLFSSYHNTATTYPPPSPIGGSCEHIYDPGCKAACSRKDRKRDSCPPNTRDLGSKNSLLLLLTEVERREGLSAPILEVKKEIKRPAPFPHLHSLFPFWKVIYKGVGCLRAKSKEWEN